MSYQLLYSASRQQNSCSALTAATTTTNLGTLGCSSLGNILTLALLFGKNLCLLRLLFILGLLDSFLDLTECSFTGSITNFRLFSPSLLDNLQCGTNY
ncbi:hypothetical protein M0R45_018937 [Rubus argutus]|uniref:Uncharacterized protein n=1 Tax=Rubus argutus TaxID=59490 RepID=A0AAW1X7H3_RUBAR